MTRASSAEPTKIRGAPDFSCSSVTPAARCHGLAKNSEYQRPPRTNIEAAAASTASGLRAICMAAVSPAPNPAWIGEN